MRIKILVLFSSCAVFQALVALWHRLVWSCTVAVFASRHGAVSSYKGHFLYPSQPHVLVSKCGEFPSMPSQGNVSTRARNASLRRRCHSQQNLHCALCVKGMLVCGIVKSVAIGKKWAGQRNLLPLLYRHPALSIPAQWHWGHLNAKKWRGNRAEDPPPPVFPFKRAQLQNALLHQRSICMGSIELQQHLDFLCKWSKDKGYDCSNVLNVWYSGGINSPLCPIRSIYFDHLMGSIQGTLSGIA